MAVVQISKIQLRRGQASSQGGVPQLSSAEMAWAIDTQELFIGNGSVAEGAPYVGNTKILTEHDNILDLASGYRFASQDPTISSSIFRSLQEKLDEIQVSVQDFGAVGDGITDNATAFENAFDNLFSNVNSSYNKVLVVPNGVYLFSRDLRIPGNVIIRGETQKGSVLKLESRNIRFVAEGGIEQLSLFTSTNRPRNIQISNITISRTTGSVSLSGVADSIFKHVVFKGDFELTNPVSNIFSESAAVSWTNENFGTRVDNVTFDSCEFVSNKLCVALKTSSIVDTAVSFKDTTFFVAHAGVLVDVPTNTKVQWLFDRCVFMQLETFAFKSLNGTDTMFLRCKFQECGNGANLENTPQTPIVEFEQRRGNLLVDCVNDRQQAAGITNITGETVAITEVLNSSRTNFINRNYGNIGASDSFSPLAVFSAKNRFFIINYFLRLGVYSRTGQLTISISDDFSHAALTDSYQYSPSQITDPGGLVMTNFEFGVSLLDNDDEPQVDTVLLSYQNPLSSNNDSTVDFSTGTITFDVEYGA